MDSCEQRQGERRQIMRQGLQLDTLRGIYGRIARRYDAQHSLITLGADQRGRKLVVERTVSEGDKVLDCGSGTGSTASIAADRTGKSGHVTLFDLSEDMLVVAREKLRREGFEDRATFMTGDMLSLPFPDNTFDSVLSTYSLCPLFNPSLGALELLRVVRKGGSIGIAHSADPKNPAIKFVANRIESIAWRIPSLSMGCRAVDVLPALENAGASVVLCRSIGVPFWPFAVIVVQKPL